MIKVYCDRCGGEIKGYDGPRSEIIEAANGDDILFTVEVHAKETGKDNYLYNSPELCPVCMRTISDAIKKVWDGNYKGLRRSIPHPITAEGGE